MKLMTIALCLLFAVVAAGQEQPLDIARKAGAAYAAGNYTEAADLYLQFTRLLPWSPGGRIQAARSLARAGKPAEALEELERVVAFGVRFNPADEAWSAIRGDARFARLESQMRARTAPLVRSAVAFRLEKDLIPENIAFDPKSGAFFVGSMYKSKIIRVATDGAMTDFVPPRGYGLLSVAGMKVDPVRRELWAAASNFGDTPPMEVEDPPSRGKGALFRFNVDTGKLVGTYWTPLGTPKEPMMFNDLVLTPAGDVYTTAGAHGIWRLRGGTGKVESFAEPDGSFFNGIAITPDGKTLFAASHLRGVVKIDVATKAQTLLNLPPGVALGGIDGLYVHGDSLVGIQNGTDPVRVIRAWLNPAMTRVTRFVVLEQEHPESDIPLTGTIVGDHLYYVARSQLRAFDGKKIWPAEKLKDSIILKLPLEMTAAPAPDLEAERAALLDIHRRGIRAHIELDADALAAGQDDDFVSASQGKIHARTREDTRRFFTGYLEGASYPLYEDAEPPIIRVSDDASMAWILSRLRVTRVKGGQEASFVYAGIMVYEKRNGRWVRAANVSTFE